MKNKNNYFDTLFQGITSLGVGLRTTMKEFFTKKITEQYPENRKELQMFDRFRVALTMPHNAENEHHCIACGLCQNACPNGSIRVVSEMVETEDGKKKKQLLRYEYNLGSCMFCQLCTNACPHNAIEFSNEFESAVFDRNRLIRTLDNPGSKVATKKQ
jgi:NADH-quinone oxidoreductase subunit I